MDYAVGVKRSPGEVRDAIMAHLAAAGGAVAVREIVSVVGRQLGGVPESSVRSYLALNTPRLFVRTDRGYYRLAGIETDGRSKQEWLASVTIGAATLHHGDAFAWLARRRPCSIQAVVTDPPYGVVEYSRREQAKLRAGKGGVWRIPPSFDGHQRAPLPRFTTLGPAELREVYAFNLRLARALMRVLVPGANVVIASNPLLVHLVAKAVEDAGFEPRGNIVRLVMTLRGGDRPKNAHAEFRGVSVLPRSMFEPWVIARKPLEGRVQDNLRTWGTGGWRRPGNERPFGDVIVSSPTPKRERQLAPHPSLKPQAFLRAVVRGVLPLGEGLVYDPFAGAGSTLAAANAVGYSSVGTELDADYFTVAAKAIAPLSRLVVKVEPS